jgi:hypothetical protein
VSDEDSAVDAERVEEPSQSLTVTTDGVVRIEWCVASTKAEKVEDDKAVSWRQLCDDIEPEVARCRKSVYEDDGLACPAATCRVVVNPLAGEVYEFAAHR